MTAAGRRGFWIGVALLALSLVAFFALGAAGWPGEPATCLDAEHGFCYGERPRAGALIQQPACTWSSLAYALAGLWILWRLGAGAPQASRNPLLRPSACAVGYGLIALSVGPGSMFFHAALTRWSQWVDQASMHLLTSWLIAYAVTRVGRLGRGWFAGIFAALFVAANAIILTWTQQGPLVFAVAITVAFGCLAWLVAARWDPPKVRGWIGLGGSAAMLGVAFFFRWASEKEGRPMYAPDTWLQGHAVWHVLGALALLVLFFFLRSEESRGGGSLCAREALAGDS
jgi:ceramidase